ncbi:MAG: DUF3575 domain-containing protein [Candidatus Cryptobacteroides sp.]
MYRKSLIAFLLALLPLLGASAQQRKTQRPFEIHYRFDRIDVDPDYLDNQASIDTIRYYLNLSSHVDSITVYAWASPEGGHPHNKWLSEKRAEAARQLILELSEGTFDEGKIKISPEAENWIGLTDMVEKHYRGENREKLLRILHNRQGVGEETLKWRIKNMDDGKTWDYLVKNYMRRLRSATWVCVWSEHLVVPVPQKRVVDTLAQPIQTIERQVEAVRYDYSKTQWALKTNLLYDAVSAVNLGVEVPIGEDFSLNAHLLFPWWTAGPYGNKYALQILNAEGEFRWWFAPGEDKLQGHYVALQGSGGKFDIQWGRDFGCYQCYNWGVGLSYGYAMSLTEHWNLEFALTLGYMSIDYQHYVPSPDWSILIRDNARAGTLQYFGPTSLKVSLVYPFRSTKSKGRK